MEIPVIERISSLEAELNLLQNPSLIARVSHLERIEEISLIHSFWTWGALILAFIATFRFSIVRSKFVIFRFRKDKSTISESPLTKPSNEDHNEDNTCSSSSLSDDEDEPRSPLKNQEPFDDDSRVAGTGDYEEYQEQNRKLKLSRRRSGGDNFSWSDFTNGKSVVKSWDGIGLGLGFENSSGNLISIWDLNKNKITSSFCSGKCQISAVSIPSPSLIVSEGLENNRKVDLRVWDARVGRQIPEIFAEWQPRRRNVAGIDSGEGNKLYVRDIRNVGSTLEALTESDVKTLWDADAIIVDGDRELYCFDVSPKKGCESAVSRCRNAVFTCFSVM